MSSLEEMAAMDSDSEDDASFDPNAPADGSDMESGGSDDDSENDNDDEDEEDDANNEPDAAAAAVADDSAPDVSTKPAKREREGAADGANGDAGAADNDDDDDDDDIPVKRSKKSSGERGDGEEEEESEEARKERKRLKKEKKQRAKEERRAAKKEKKAMKKEKARAAGLFDDNASVSGSDDSDEEEEENENEYVKDGFVIDSEDEESGTDEEVDNNADSDDDDVFERTKEDDEDEDGKKKKKKKKKLSRLQRVDEEGLDAEDLDLVAEARALAEDNAAMDMGATGAGGEDDEGAGDDDIMPERAEQPGQDDEDMDDFIEDDLGEEGGETGGATGERRVAKQTGAQKRASQGQINDMIDIFGEHFLETDMDGSGSEGEEEEDDYDLMQGAEDAQRDKKVNKLMSRFERETIVEKFMTEGDAVFREKDVPERFVDNVVAREKSELSLERLEATRPMQARWIARRLVEVMDRSATVDLDRYTSEEALPKAVETVLRFIQVDQFEVPFIWAYRRDDLNVLLTRDYLWFICAQNDKWNDLLRLRTIVADELDALESAAEVDETKHSEEVRMEREAVREVEDNIDDLQGQLLEARERQGGSGGAGDGDDEIFAVSPSGGDSAAARDPTSAAAAVADIREKITTQEIMLSRARESLNALLSASAKQSKYSPEVAKAVLERCPRGKYTSLLEVSEFMIEEHFSDVHHFVRLLASGAQAAAAARAKADREERRRNPLSAADAELQLQGDYSGDGANADDLDGVTRAGIRRLKSVSAEGYATACKIPGLREFARSFVNDVHALGDGLMYGMNFKQDVPEPYDDVAAHCKNYIEACGGLVGTPRSQEALQRHARALMAAEVAAEPRVRQHMRDTYMARASLSTTPTAKGVDTISAFHDLFGLHMLKDKPLSQFRNTEGGPLLFVKLMRAQKEGLISVNIDVPQVSLDDGGTIDDLDVFLNYATSGGYSMRQIWLPTGSSGAVAKEWDSVRDRILREALSVHLLPAFKKDFTRELTRKGKEAIIDEAALNYRKLVTVGPYRLRAMDPAKETRQFLLNKLEALSIVAVNLPQSSHDDASISAIDRSGKVIKSDLIPARSIKAKQLRERIKEFIKLMNPMVIVLNSSSGRMGRSMKNTIERNMVPQIVEEKRADARRLRNAHQDAMDTAEFDDDDDDFFDYKPDVVLVKDDVARVFAMSRRAASLFPDMEPSQAQAVCLARFAQEPLAEYCNMWSTCDGCHNFGFETLFLDLHPQQSELKGYKGLFLAALQRELVNAVADAGVELNMCIEHQHLQQQLAFVPGMGLRKADNLRQNMKRVLPTAIARRQLLEKGLLKACVYKNAAGFLKIEDVSESTTRVSPLEATRIHPEQYDEERIVQRMCANAEGEENNDETKALQFVDAVQKRSRKAIKQRCKEFDHERWIEIWRQGERPSVQNFDVLRQTDTGEDYRDTGELMDTLVSLDLDDYDRILIAGGAPRSQIKRLNFIKEELRFPYLDMRPPLREPDPDEMFTLVTGETDSSLHVGLRVSATVTSIPDDYKAQVRLEGGLNGQIDISEISDNNEHHVVASALSEGQQVRAVVIKVDKYRMRVDLSLKTSYVDKPECWWVQNRHGNMYMEDWCRATNRLRFDQFFDESRAVDELFKLQADEEDRARMAAQGSVSITKAGQAMNTLARRQIYHPAFMNIDHMEAEKHLLKKCDVGECIIRPGNKGANYLSISWYFQPDMIRHVEVREEDKDGEYGLGRKLFVRGIEDPYSDLDDLIANYVGAMNDHVTAMLDFKYYRQGAMATTLDAMSAMKKAAPKKVPFYVVLDAKQPGYFLLTWCIDINKPFGREYIALHPGGFKFRDQIYEGPRGPIVIFTDWLKKKMSKRGALTPGGGVAPVVAAAAAAAPRRSRFAAATPLTDSATTPYSAAPTPLSTGGGARSGRSRFSAA